MSSPFENYYNIFCDDCEDMFDHGCMKAKCKGSNKEIIQCLTVRNYIENIEVSL